MLDNYHNFHNHIDIKQYKSIICLDGELPLKEFFVDINNLPIIAVDGAAHKLKKLGVEYDILIGDLDSVKKDEIDPNKRNIYLPSQDFSDFQKTIEYLKQNNLLPAIILGVSGGNIDHILYNINVFTDLDSIFFAPPIIGKMIISGTTETLSLPIMTKISIMALPQALVTTSGLKWNIRDTKLIFGGMQSCFNRAAEKVVTISVQDGRALLMIYTSDVNDCGSE